MSRSATSSVAAFSRRFSRRSGILLILSIVAGVAVAGVALPVVGLVGAVAKTSADTFNDLPTQLLIPPLPQSSHILDDRGNILATLHGTEDRVPVTLDQVPGFMQQAIIDIEDSRFYEHHGIDYKGIIRAAARNQEAGQIEQGGSTLTQQYVKNVLIESAKTPAQRKEAIADTLSRKLREARYALALERKLTKKQILIRYLNIAYFGDGAYGIGAAARHYFSVDIKDINLVQAALLAGLVRNPSAYDPILHPKAARDRRDTVLARMHQLGHLSTKVYKYALTFGLLLNPNKAATASDSCTNAYAPFYCRYVVDKLLNDPKFGKTPEDRQKLLFTGGLTIKTSLDPDVQKAAQDAVDKIVPPGNRVAAATDVVQPGTGKLLAMAVNRVYGDATSKPDFVHSKYPYATIGNGQGFQAGSTFKLFTLATALSQGLPLSTTYISPQCVEVKGLNSPGPCPVSFFTPDGVGYRNAGDSESGVFNMVTGTWFSVNTYYVQLEGKLGVQNIRDMAKKLGVTSTTMDNVGPVDGSFTLGAFNVSVLDVATAYATIAAHGKRCYPLPILSVTSDGGNVPFTTPAPCEQVLEPQIADTITGVLEGVVTQPGATATAHGYIGRTAAGKTGTTDDFHGAFFVGFVPQLAAAVWVGDSRNPVQYPLDCSATTPECVPVPGWNGGQVFGGDLPTMIWADLMQGALANQPVEPMPPAVTAPLATPLNAPPPPPPPPPPPAPAQTVAPPPSPSSAPTHQAPSKPTPGAPPSGKIRGHGQTQGAHNSPGHH